jgi:hypothetical protein
VVLSNFVRSSGTATVNASDGQVPASSKGTAASSETTVTDVTLTVSMNGKSETSAGVNINQTANSYSDDNFKINDFLVIFAKYLGF